MVCKVTGGWQRNGNSAFLCKALIALMMKTTNIQRIVARSTDVCYGSSNSESSCNVIFVETIQIFKDPLEVPRELTFLCDWQADSVVWLWSHKSFTVKANTIIMSFTVKKPDSYQYQIITLLHFQLGEQIAFLRGDTGQDGWKRDDVRCCSDSRFYETSGHTEAPLASSPPPLPLTSSAPYQDVNIWCVLSVTVFLLREAGPITRWTN